MIGRVFRTLRGKRRRTAARPHARLPYALLLALIGVIAMPAALLPGEAPGRIDEAAKRALSDSAIQKELPGLGGARSRPRPDPRGGETARRPSDPLPSDSGGAAGVGSFGKLFLWAIVIVAGVALLFFVLREVLSLRLGTGRKRFEEADATVVAGAAGTGEGGGPPGLLDEADRLAARGAFGEAIHLILMHSVRRLERAGEQAIGRSLTGREILRRTSITARARELLGTIVGASELAHFGGRPADAAAYARCRQAFERFAAETGAAT
jgi:hypothetical protein